jgi:hypothetical protein
VSPTSVALSYAQTKQERLVRLPTLVLNNFDNINQTKKVPPNSVCRAMPVPMGSNSKNTYALTSDIAVTILSPYMGIS